MDNKENEIRAFRNILAEMGTEMNLEDARKAYEASKEIMKRSRRMSMKDLWDIDEMEDVPKEQRQEALELYMRAKEL